MAKNKSPKTRSSYATGGFRLTDEEWARIFPRDSAKKESAARDGK